MSTRAHRLVLLTEHQAALRACSRCPDMFGPSVVGNAVLSEVLLVGQAPGDKEPALGRPFAWTAGKQLFKWFAPLGLSESEFRALIYMSAVCRCFPGKGRTSGDRVPGPHEIDRCRPWLLREIDLLRPRLIVPVGKLAIGQFLPLAPLTDLIGSVHSWRSGRRLIDVIPLPHPSGASTWPRTEPGKTLTARALQQIGEHPSFRDLLRRCRPSTSQ